MGAVAVRPPEVQAADPSVTCKSFSVKFLTKSC